MRELQPLCAAGLLNTKKIIYIVGQQVPENLDNSIIQLINIQIYNKALNTWKNTDVITKQDWDLSWLLPVLESDIDRNRFVYDSF